MLMNLVSIDRPEAVGSAKVLMTSPASLPPEVALEDIYGLSRTTSECLPQTHFGSSRREIPDGVRVPASEGGDLNSWMPIVDEEDQQARALSGGRCSSEEEHPVLQSMCNDEFRRSAYERQVQRWQQDEMAYLKHEGWCEHRLILLIQEAFRCSNHNLKRAFNAGAVSAEVYAARVTGLKSSLLRIKAEYRRALQRAQDRKGDLPSIASKAVTCIASVYPWSSSGFLIGFEENVRFGQLVEVTGSGGRHGGTLLASPELQQFVNVALCPCRDLTPVAKMMLPGMCPEHRNAPAPPSHDRGSPCHGRYLAAPHITLRPLPARYRLFQKGSASDGSPLLSPACTGTSADTVYASGPLAMECPNRSFFAASPICLSPKSPVHVPTASIAGPFRSDEQRFLEKRQLVVQGMAFVSLSLASSIFISSRRAAIASARMRERLTVVADKAQPPVSSSTPCVNAAGTQPSPASPVTSTTSMSSSKANPINSDSGELVASTMNPSSLICRTMPCPSPSLAPGNGSFCVDPSPRTLVTPSPPAYAEAVAFASQCTPGHLVRYPSCYPRQIRRDRMCRDRAGLPSSFSMMPPVSLEEEKHVKELW
ncbi:hypothetical protein CUR178_04368 [Leishmania enriettii]|uniref:Ch28 protein n=1 Tax=Leishmania enriettii TaxID=5663 RepID=A0A836H4D9_LEIEN|nr:hypothetical protein CUR178_04368 [Leishmania enriettii]